MQDPIVESVRAHEAFPAEIGAIQCSRWLKRGSLCTTLALNVRRGRAVLKHFPFDLGVSIPQAADPRIRSLPSWLAVPPYFSSMSERLRRAANGIGDAAPNVLGEGVVADGARFVVLSWIEGETMDTCVQRERSCGRSISAGLGALARVLHAANPATDDGGRSWDSLVAEWLHAVVDGLPGLAVGASDRWRMRVAVETIAARLGGMDPGPRVLVHGDLNPSNVIVDPNGAITGLIDFELACDAPASVDFRFLDALDADAFLDGYGVAAARRSDARWLGVVHDLLWQGIAMLTASRCTPLDLGADYWTPYVAQFAYLMGVAAHEPLRLGQEARRLAFHRRCLRRCGTRIARAIATQSGRVTS